MRCPFCNNELEVIDVDIEGYDILGCEECEWSNTASDDDMKFFI